MNAMHPSYSTIMQAHRLRLRGLAVIEGRHGLLSFRKLVQIKPGRQVPVTSASKRRRFPMRR